MKPLTLAGLAVLLVVTAPAAALAHAEMVNSIPKNGSTVTAGLSQIELNFSKPLRVSIVHVRDATHQNVALKSKLPTAFAATVRFSVDALTPGSYEVSWTAVAEDGHVMKGTFAFSVRADAPLAK